MSKRNRASLSIRLQPYVNTLSAEVTDWLNSFPTDEKNRLITDALVMAYLPYARASQNVSHNELERCCWETQNMLDKHGFNLRQSLQISQPQWSSTLISQEGRSHLSQDLLSNTVQDKQQNSLDEEKVKNEDEELILRSLIEGKAQLDNGGLFNDDEFD